MVESHLERLLPAALSGVPTWPQAVVAEFMDEGHFATHIRTMRQALQETSRHAARHKPPGLEPSLQIDRSRQPAFTPSACFGNLSATTKRHSSAPQADRGLTLSGIGRYCLSRFPKRKGRRYRLWRRRRRRS
jgi:GntR family transcriptional regulator/MocR family aminotransferase